MRSKLLVIAAACFVLLAVGMASADDTIVEDVVADSEIQFLPDEADATSGRTLLQDASKKYKKYDIKAMEVSKTEKYKYKPEKGCKDKYKGCADWYKKGYCKAGYYYKDFSVGYYWCAKTCNYCKGCYDYYSPEQCKYWKPYCVMYKGNYYYYKKYPVYHYCKSTCKKC